MASARPVIATAWGGPADYLDATCGFLIAPTSRAALVAGFAQSMQILLHTPGLGQTLGLAGRTRLLAHFTWASRIDQILALYKSIQARP
jgi:glycosyltransferase involved in cell wall biosynthesis